MSRRTRSRARWRISRRRLSTRAIRALIRAGRRGVKRLKFQTTYGGRAHIDFMHTEWRAAGKGLPAPTQPGRTQPVTTQTKPHTPNTPPNHNARALVLPEGRAVARAAAGIEDWNPAGATEVHEMLVTLAAATAMYGTAVLAVAETLARKGADPVRIVAQLIGCAEAIGGAAHTFQAVDRVFLHLYAGDLEQDQSPAAPMVYAEAGRR